MSSESRLNLKVTVIIVTLNRPDFVRKCLQCLAVQTRLPEQVIVVDASPGEETRKVVGEFTEVLYLRNDEGFGRMTASRNIGLMQAAGDLVAFVDDDAFAMPDWLEQLLETYRDTAVAAVGGRVLSNGMQRREWDPKRVGTVLSNGTLYAGFESDPGRVLSVDHIMGCNMSFRRAMLAKLGGFREDYPGISGVCEDSDMCLRIRSAGGKIAFNPAAVVDHIGAPQVRGRRFDARYNYYAAHNNLILLVRNYGYFAGVTWRFLFAEMFDRMRDCLRSCKTLSPRAMAGQMWRSMAYATGLAWGLIVGIKHGLRGGGPERHDPKGERIRAALLMSAEAGPALQGAR